MGNSLFVGTLKSTTQSTSARMDIGVWWSFDSLGRKHPRIVILYLSASIAGDVELLREPGGQKDDADQRIPQE